ncbi:MAG: GNAT family N-acetyltransferase [bacterium]
MKLKELNGENVEQVRQWRNQCLETLRTPFLLTKDMQQRFYEEDVCNRNSRNRWWGIHVNNGFIGQMGLINIELENRRAEISIMINPEYQYKGYGTKAVELLLEQGFMHMNLENIWGEVYTCNINGMVFWERLVKKYNGNDAFLKNTKYYNGRYWNSLWFNIAREDYIKCLK